MSLNPPFTEETAHLKVKKAQDLWNTKYGSPFSFSLPLSILRSDMPNRDPVSVSKAYTPDCIWRNRHWFFTGTDAIVDFLTKKWAREQNYKLRKELFAYTDNKIAVQFWYEVCLLPRPSTPAANLELKRACSTKTPKTG